MAREPDHHLVLPARACGTGVLVLSGSSGALEFERAQLLADHGAVALALRWFGGPDQQPGPWEVPLERFAEALDSIAPNVDRLAILGASFGAEAALSVAARVRRVDAVIAVSPSAYVWPAADERQRQRSHWTVGGTALEFVPIDETWVPTSDPPAYRGLYERSLRTFPDAVAPATIPVELIDGELLLIAGGDDQVWPAADWAHSIEQRRRAHGLATAQATHPGAGHRLVLPGEQPVRRGQTMLRGGNDAADAELGQMAWPHICEALQLHG